MSTTDRMMIRSTPGRVGLSSRTLVLALLLALASPTDASVVRALSLQQLVEGASVIAVVAVESASSAWVGGRIVTDSVVAVVEGLDGASAGERLFLRTLGGEIDGIGQRVFGEPRLRPGERYLVFLEALPPSAAASEAQLSSFRPVGMSQGALPVVDGDEGLRVVPSLELLELVGPDAALPARPWLEDARPLADVVDEVQALLPAGRE